MKRETRIHPIILLLLFQLFGLPPDDSILLPIYAQDNSHFQKLQTPLFLSSKTFRDTTDTSTSIYSNKTGEGTNTRSNKNINFVYSSIQLEPFDYYRSVERFHLYDPSYGDDLYNYRRDLIRHDRNLQHYKNNLFLMREAEFNKMGHNWGYMMTKQGLVMANYLLTGGLTPDRFGDSRYLVLKSQKKLILNGSLNLLHKVFGSQNVEKRSGWIALDVHVHTYNSFDGTSNIETLLLTANKKGFGAITITDHDYFDDAHKALRTASKLKKDGRLPKDFVVIPGMEISSRDGHILGLFLNAYIPHGMSAEQTIAEIHSQGGLAIAPHPFQPDFGVGGKLVKNLPFDGMVVTGFGVEFQLSLNLSKEVQDRMAIFMDSDTHVENGLAWMGYTLVRTDDHTSEGIYNAIKAKQTEPVHRNIMRFQKKIISKTPLKFVAKNISQLYNFRFRLEDDFARLLMASRISIHGLVPNLINDLIYLNLFNPASDQFLGANMLNNYFISGFTAYYGPLYLDVQKEDQSFNTNLGIKLFW